MNPEVNPSILMDVVCRTDFEAFFERCFYELHPGRQLERTWHISAIAHRLEQLQGGEIDRLLITLPPRHLKSEMGSVAFTAWIMGKSPGLRILSTSYGQDLVERFHGQTRRIIDSQWYANVFPETVAGLRRRTNTTIELAQGGARDATSLGGAITGFGYDYIIIDDPLKAEEVSFPAQRETVQRLYQQTLQSRIEDKRSGRILIIMQRLHEDDLGGFILGLDSGVTHLNLPAIALKDEIIPLTRGRRHVRRIGELLNPIREPQEVLDRLRREMGSRSFMAQYQQEPGATDSDYLRWEEIQRYDEVPPRNRLFKVVMSWDTASSTSPTADYSVGTTWGFDGEAWLLLDLIRVKLSYSDLLDRIRAERRRWRADRIIVEKQDVGAAILDELSRDMRELSAKEHHAPYCIREAACPRLGKVERFISQIERLYTGQAKFPKSAPWLDELRKELQAFPESTRKDQADSISQFLMWCVGPGGRVAMDESMNPRGERR